MRFVLTASIALALVAGCNDRGISHLPECPPLDCVQDPGFTFCRDADGGIAESDGRSCAVHVSAKEKCIPALDNQCKHLGSNDLVLVPSCQECNP